MNKALFLGIVFCFLAAVAGFAYYAIFLKRGGDEITPVLLEEEQGGLGSELYGKTANPAEKVPEINPLEKIRVNPLDGVNPFEGGYKNPFE
ncbi:MAG: hypothetical protein HY482_00670 [Candidatus Wildermuthbacteria bacterium]|nr:hypothetical protein [Candidatus Wildermuthbacteria bacterium]